MKRLKYLWVAFALAASACCKPADPFASRPSSPPPPPAAVAAPGIWSFEFSNATPGDPDADHPVIATAYFKITKHDPDSGEVQWTRIYKEGEALGFDREGVSVHPVFSKKRSRQVAVDFNCGGKIEKIQVDKDMAYEYQVCNVKPGPKGPVCVGPEKVKANYRVNEIIYTVEHSRRQAVQWASSPGPKSDRLCPEHGGPAVPEMLTPDELLAQRVAEAAALLDEAHTLWVSDKPADRKKAQGIYRKLIDTYSDLPDILPRKTELRERARKKIN